MWLEYGDWERQGMAEGERGMWVWSQKAVHPRLGFLYKGRWTPRQWGGK